MKFAIDDLVVEKEDIQASTSFSVKKVVTILNGDLVCAFCGTVYGDALELDDYEIEPGTRSYHESYMRFQEHELFSLEEAKAERSRLEGAAKMLEATFEAVRGKIAAKLNQATVLVAEAGELAKLADRTLNDMKYDGGKELYEALKEAGWRSSHMSC